MRKMYIGIDIGSTNTVMASCKSGRRFNVSHIREISQHVSRKTIECRKTLPSVLYLTEDGEAIVGEYANHQKEIGDKHVLYNTKYQLGNNITYDLGLTPKQVTTEIEKSSRVIAFITENSINFPWLTYETGYSDGLKTCDYLPVRFGVTLDKIPSPLQIKHISGLNSIKEMHSFLDKLLNIFDITYDQEAFEKVVSNTWADMRTIYSAKKNIDSPSDFSLISSRLENLEKKLDAYFGTGGERLVCPSENEYDIEVLLPNEHDQEPHSEVFSIDSNTTVAEILNEVYFLLNGAVRPFTYLESWVLFERSTQMLAIISDIQEQIPACFIFSKNSQWEVRLIDESDALLSKTKIKLLKEKLSKHKKSDLQLESDSPLELDDSNRECWYIRDPELYKAEVTAMKMHFPQFELRKMEDGRIAWIGDTKQGNSKYTLLLVYDNNFPTNKNWDGLIRVYIVKPDLSKFESVYGHGIPHTLRDNAGNIYLCTARGNEVGIGRARTSAVSTLAWAIKWLCVLELYMSGDISYEKFVGHTF